MASDNKEQQHPLYNRDRLIVNNLLTAEVTNYNLAELARLQIRYRGFPGATDIQTDLEQVMQNWGFTETTLYEKTRQIHAGEPIYQGKAKKGEEEDWN